MAAQKADCIFCKIIRNEEPGEKIYEVRKVNLKRIFWQLHKEKLFYYFANIKVEIKFYLLILMIKLLLLLILLI